jgi:hypothetical protein
LHWLFFTIIVAPKLLFLLFILSSLRGGLHPVWFIGTLVAARSYIGPTTTIRTEGLLLVLIVFYVYVI